jgi:hypothetical protein
VFRIGFNNKAWESWIKADGAAKFGACNLSDYSLFIESGDNYDIFLEAKNGIRIGTTSSSLFHADTSGNLTITGNLSADALTVNKSKSYPNGIVNISTTLKVDKIEPYTTDGTVTISSVAFDSLLIEELYIGTEPIIYTLNSGKSTQINATYVNAVKFFECGGYSGVNAEEVLLANGRTMTVKGGIITAISE